MKISVLASGSKGNSTYIEHNNTKILIDMGMSCNYIEKKLISMGVTPNSINGILITHIHIDHIAGIKTFCKKYNTPIFISPKAEHIIKEYVQNPNIVHIKKEMSIKDIEIKVIKNSHDTESLGFILNNELVYITDTGYLNSKYFDMLNNKVMYIIESNHDIEMLMEGSYPHHLKQRILGDKGHLSNKDCSYYLSKLIGDKTKYIILAHLSEDNNTKEKAIETLMLHNIDKKIKTIVSQQKEKTELVEI